MANQFTTQEQVMFDDMVEGFDDALIIGKLATKYRFPPPRRWSAPRTSSGFRRR
jgi:hypothetical protein